MIPESEKLEPCPFCGDRMQNRRGLVMHHDLDRPRCIIGDNSFPIEWADRWNRRACRLTRQEDETRKAALEEAAKVAEAWALKSPSQLRLHGGEMTVQEVRTAKAFMTVVCGAIRALKEAGHG